MTFDKRMYVYVHVGGMCSVIPTTNREEEEEEGNAQPKR